MNGGNIDFETWRDMYVLLNVALFCVLFIVSIIVIAILCQIIDINTHPIIQLLSSFILAIFLYPKKYSISIYKNGQKCNIDG